MRPDGKAVLPPIGNKAGVFCILEYKRMSDVTEQYVLADPTNGRERIRIPSKHPQRVDTSSRLEGGTNQLYNGVTLCERAGPNEKPKVPQSPGGQHRVYLLETNNEGIRCIREYSQMYV
jgi:hypothetical protein